MRPVSYAIWKTVHLLGVILLVGNVTVTSIWKVFADRTGDARTIAFAQRLVTGTDWTLTAGGIALTVVGGYAMSLEAGYSLLGDGWLLWSQVAFVAAGAIWLAVLLPIQVEQARLARAFADGGPVPARYRALARRWLVAGLVATAPLGVATWLMVAKVPR